MYKTLCTRSNPQQNVKYLLLIMNDIHIINIYEKKRGPRIDPWGISGVPQGTLGCWSGRLLVVAAGVRSRRTTDTNINTNTIY